MGFRFATATLARELPVVGFVQNLADGTVLLVAEGREADLAEFVVAVERAMKGCIAEVVRKTLPATGEFTSFGVRYRSIPVV